MEGYARPWRHIEPYGTFVRSDGSATVSCEASRSNEVVALRQVVLPSLARLVDTAALAAAAVDQRSAAAGAIAAPVLEAAALPAHIRGRLARRRLDALLPIVEAAAERLSPLQLLGDLRCIRLYHVTVQSGLARDAYFSLGSWLNAIEQRLERAAYAGVESVRYADFASADPAVISPTEAPLYIAGTAVDNGRYRPLSTAERHTLQELFAGLPWIPPPEVEQMARVCESDSSRCIAGIMRDALNCDYGPAP